MSKTLILELNELCPPLIDRYIGEGRMPNLARLKERAEIYRTWTDDETLEPWAQWITYHYGIPLSEHGIRKLNQGNRVGRPALWDRIAEQGGKVLAFGPMNAATPMDGKVTMVPDAWAAGVEPSSRSFEPFLRFVAKQIKDHHNHEARFDRAEALAFLRFCMANGLTARTALAMAKQVLIDEKLTPYKRWRRALILDMLIWDVFERTFEKGDYQTGLVFLDGVGHLQHKYWRSSFPEQFERETTEEERQKFGCSIPEGYELHDRLIGRALDLVGKDGTLIIVGALSQQRNLRYEDIGGRVAYKPKSYDQLLKWAGCGSDVTHEPVMAHQTWAVAPTIDRIADVAAALARVVRTDTGEPIFRVQEPVENKVFFFCSSRTRIDDNVEIRAGNGETTARFGDLFVCLGEVNSSRHNREGMFWITGPKAKPGIHETHLPLEDATAVTISAAAA